MSDVPPESGVTRMAEDINACASDALDALTEGRYADCRTQIQAILDLVREVLAAGDETA
jgi:hypothetical protein